MAAPTVDTVQESASPSPTPTPPARNDRGDMIKMIGESAGVTNLETNEQWLEFTVSDVSEVECTNSYGEELLEASGNLVLAVEIEGTTSPAMADSELFEVDPTFALDLVTEWVAFDASGQRKNDVYSNAVFNCLYDGNHLPFDIGPSESFNGIVLLEVSDRAGEIALRPWWLDGGGWSWSYDLDGPEGVDA